MEGSTVDLYPVLILLHILGAGALFATLGIEVTALHRLRRASTAEEARSWLPAFQRPGGVLGQVAFGALLLTGLGMAVLRGGLDAWMTAALTAIAAMIVLGATIHDPRLAALTAGLVGGDTSAGWRPLACDPWLHRGLWMRVGLLAGVLGLMALKPSIVGSVLTLLAGLAFGSGVAVASGRRSPDAAGGGSRVGGRMEPRSADDG